MSSNDVLDMFSEKECNKILYNLLDKFCEDGCNIICKKNEKESKKNCVIKKFIEYVFNEK